MAASLILPLFPADIPGIIGEKVRAEETEVAQVASEEETVYINSYGGTKRSRDFNDRWKFYDGDAGNDAKNVDFNDASWTSVTLPHDYSIERDYTNAGEAESAYLLGGVGWYRKNFRVDESWRGKRVTIEFDGVYMDSTVYLNGQQLGGHPYGYTPFSFELPQDVLKFGAEDNVIAVKVNHVTPSSRWYSGSGIYRDVRLTVTDRVHIDRYGIVVTTPNLESSQGADGTVQIKTTIKNDGDSSTSDVTVSHSIRKKGTEEILGSREYSISNITNGSGDTQTVDIKIENPELWNSWDKGTPNLYVLHTQVKKGDVILDQYDTTFGFRYFKFERDTGFYLNGQNMKLKGVCMHHDQGALGAEAWEAAIRRQVRILKEMGCNSIRVTHNPAAEILLTICDEEGMLVIDEAFDGWDRAKNDNTNDYARFFNETIKAENQILGKEDNMSWGEYDLKTMVLRGINSPSVIMWSLGNEIVEGASNYGHYGTKVLDLIGWVQEVDNSRKITIGDNKLKENWNLEPAQKIHEAGGIIGFNYAVWQGYHNNGQLHNMMQHDSKNWTVYASETSSAINSRGVYHFLGNGGDGATSDRLLSAYDNSRVGWGSLASESWWEVIRFDANAGEYIWTGFDYLGEPTPWNGTRQGYSSVSGLTSFTNAPKSSYFGIIDTAGFPKDSYYLYRSLWMEKDTTLHVLPTWDVEDLPGNGNPGNVKVVVYSNAPEVRLYLNDEHVETQKMVSQKSVSGWSNTRDGLYEYQTVNGQNNHTSLYYTFQVPYQRGTLKAVAYDKEGSEIKETVGRSSVTTTKGESKLAMSVDRKEITADGKDLSYITIDVQDEDGLFVNAADPTITLSITGPGKIVGVDNGLQTDHTRYQSLTRKANKGKLLAIVQSTESEGTITVAAEAEGLTGTSVQLTTKAVTEESAEGSKYPVSLKFSKIYYVLKGNTPKLPTEIKVNYSDGSVETKEVVWSNQSSIDVNTVATYEVSGAVDGNIPVTIYVTILDEVAALMNYSTFLRAGENLTLPESRPAVMKDGEILPAYFKVIWDTEGKDFSTPGMYEVQGEADVFGEKFYPTASIRVSAGNVLPGPNVAGAVSEVTSNIQENLAEVNDG
ncbi:MAG: Ig-like domain-containing protein, partial [Lachnospiraceae bacterium]|nr:Ig-like domain-containing protein [Lachnospiraceae bacterium]